VNILPSKSCFWSKNTDVKYYVIAADHQITRLKYSKNHLVTAM